MEAASTHDDVHIDRWRDAVVYQIYPRSFADSNGDGIGDLAGIISRVPYLAELGVDAVWLSPFYPSQLADGGYDIDDHRDVDPRLGSLTDVDRLVKELHAVDIQLIIDIVPNHTSNRHPWFQEALASAPGSAARDRYIFRDGTGADGSRPPSDWPSHFGGSAWTRVPDGQWYLHLYAAEQPDLNWTNPEVRADYLATLRFWADRGVDGFRVDVAHLLTKDLSEPLRSKPVILRDALPGDGSDPFEDRDEVHEIYREWRALFDQYTPPRFAVAEVWVPAARRVRYARPDSLGQAFNFDLLSAPWDASAFRQVISVNLDLAAEAGSTSTWVLSCHDRVRHASRYALPPGTDLEAWLMSGGTAPAPDHDTGVRRARAATLLMLALPGSAYLYQGEELGLYEVADLPPEVLQDPIWERSGQTRKGRDGARVPLPWEGSGPSFGFGRTAAHLPQPDGFAALSVAAQCGQPGSTLELYRHALHLRQALSSSQEIRGRFEWVSSGEPGVVHFRRGDWHSITNFGNSSVQIPAGDIVAWSQEMSERMLPPDTTAWLLTVD